MKLYLVRHGEAEGSEGRAVGHLDLPLSDPGTRNLEALAASWQGPPPVRLFASDLRRAADSARVLARRFGVEPVLDARLREVSFGEWEGRAWDEIYESDRQRYDAWTERWWDLSPPGGESFADLARRALSWFQELGDGEDAIVVAHGGSIRALLVELLAIPRERAFDLQLSPARVSAVDLRDAGCELLFLDQPRWHAA
ncbi:MAG TPA: histidine phosphatase family protein [Thermoanaerobaculia bacterium]|jgi:broad specificity phosphatase PhoE|nr:histidine phosphatase family protein [Thermoanaerobaculia bacterium]